MADLQDSVGHLIQEIPVMGYHENHALITRQIVLQPVNHRFIQMVGRLVQKQHIKIRRQDLRHRHFSPLAPGKGIHPSLKIADAELCQIALNDPVRCPCLIQRIGRNRRILRKIRILSQISDPQTVLLHNLPAIRFLHPGNNFQQG